MSPDQSAQPDAWVETAIELRSQCERAFLAYITAPATALNAGMTREVLDRLRAEFRSHLLARPPAGQGSAEDLARRFHEAYERLAPLHGYETRKTTRQFNPESTNGRTMIAVCGEILASPPPSPSVEVLREARDALDTARDALKGCREEMPLGAVSRTAYAAIVQCTAAIATLEAAIGEKQ